MPQPPTKPSAQTDLTHHQNVEGLLVVEVAVAVKKEEKVDGLEPQD